MTLWGNRRNAISSRPRNITELLELLWVLEATVVLCPEQEDLLKAVVEGACFGTTTCRPSRPTGAGRRERESLRMTCLN